MELYGSQPQLSLNNYLDVLTNAKIMFFVDG